MRYRTGIFCALTLVLGAGRMFASLLAVDDVQFGPKSILRDTATGLDWLTLDLTRNLSYNTVSANFGDGGRFPGFRYATATDVGTFFTDAGIPDIGQMTAANFQPVFTLLFQIGVQHSGDPCFCAFSEAITAESVSPGTHSVADLSVNFLQSQGSALLSTILQARDDLESSGSFIIRQTPEVPEPGVLVMVGTGLLSIFAMKRRRVRRRPIDR